MASRLPLETMTIEEKLREMEALWEDLSRRANAIEPPAWHGDVLKAIEERIERGEEKFENWATAKRKINIEKSQGKTFEI